MICGWILPFILSAWTIPIRAQESFDVLRLKLKEFQTFHIEPRGDPNQVVTNHNLNRKDCKTSADCAIDETCQKVCFWLNPEDLWVGCKINCVPTTEAILYEVLVRKESGFLPNVPDSVTYRPDTFRPDTPARTASTLSGLVETALKAPESSLLSPFADQMDAVRIHSGDHTELAVNESKIASPTGKCLSATVCPMLCSVAIDEKGCQQCSCPHVTKPGNCMLNHHCGDLNQYCLRAEKRCVCREGFVAIQANPLKCSQQSPEDEFAFHGAQKTESLPAAPQQLEHDSVPPKTAPSPVTSTARPHLTTESWKTTPVFPKPQHFGEGIRKQAYGTENGEAESHTVSERHKTDSDPMFDESQSFLSTETIPRKQKTFDPSSFWRALMVISGTTSAPTTTAQGGVGELASRCASSSDCLPGLQCCVKSFCDGYNSCGTALFCLTTCSIE